MGPNHVGGSGTERVVALLTSIDATLKLLLQDAQQRSARLRDVAAQVASAAEGQQVASDADLDGQYGDPEVKAKDPRDWTGPSMRGYRFSECSPEYLDMLAERYDYFARKNEEEGDEQKAKYAKKDAARARGWARRLRGGWKPAEPSGAFRGFE